MTNDTSAIPDEDSKACIRKSLALAAAHGIGPFRKRVRLEDPQPYEPDEVYTSFTIDVRAPEPEWKYDGQLKDKPATLTKTNYPLPRYEDETYYGSGNFKNYLTANNIGILAHLDIGKELSLRDYFGGEPKGFDNGFTFNRNGMCYRIEFFKPYSHHTPTCEFSISSSEDGFMSFIDQRPMTRQEAKYALGIVKAELDPYDQVRLKAHIERLGNNLPIETEPQKTVLEGFKDIKFMDPEKYPDLGRLHKSPDPAYNTFKIFHIGDPAMLGQKMKQYIGNLPKP